MKKRVSLSLDGDLIGEIDERVDGIVIKSRSDAIERMLRERIMERKTAVILAGGDPKKLLVKGLNVYRPLVNVNGKKLIEDVILKCRENGFVNIIVIGFPSVIAKLYEVLGNGKKYGVCMTYVEERKALGTAKTLELAKGFLKTDFLFLPCDHYFDFDLKKLYDFHVKQNGTATLAIHTRTSWERGVVGGIVELDGYKIISHDETPKEPKTNLFSTFVGFLKGDVFNLIPPGEVRWSLQENIFPRLAKEGKLVGYPVVGNWVNVHTEKDVERAVEVMRSKR